MSLFSKIGSAIKSGVKTVSKATTSVVKSGFTALNKVTAAPNKLISKANAATRPVVTPLLKGATVLAATSVGSPLLGAFVGAAVKQTGGKLDVKTLVKDSAVNAVSSGAASAAMTKRMTAIAQNTAIGSKALGAVVTVQNKVGNVGVNALNSVKTIVTSKGVTAVQTKVGTVATKAITTASQASKTATSLTAKATSTATKALSNVVTKIEPITVKPVVKPVALVNSEVQKMTEKAMQAGKININEIAQTLANKGLPATQQAVNTVKQTIHDNSRLLTERTGATYKPLSVVNELTTSTLQNLVPTIDNVVRKVQETGKVDLTKVKETLINTGIEATGDVLEQVGEAIRTKACIDAPIVNNPEKSNTVYYILGGLAAAAVAAVLIKRK